MTEWPPRLDQGRDEVCVASGFPVCSEGMARPCPVAPAPSLGSEQVPPVPAPTPGAGAQGGAKDGGPEPGGHNSQDRNQSWSLRLVLPFAAQRSPMDGVEQSLWPVLLCPQSHPQRRVRPAAFTSGPARWTPGPCPRCPLGSEPRLACGRTFLGPTIAGHFAARPGSPGAGQLLAVGRRGGCLPWVSSCAPGAERRGSCMWPPRPPRPPALVPLAPLPVGAPSSHLPGTLLWAGPGPCPAPQAFGLPLIRAPPLPRS